MGVKKTLNIQRMILH